MDAVRKTGKALPVSGPVERWSLKRTHAANPAQISLDHLDAPPMIVGSSNWITPVPKLEAVFFPQPGGLIDAIH